jgi:MFS family permease
LALTVATVTWTTAAWIQAHVARQASPRRMIRLGLSIIVVGILGITGVLLSDVSIWFGPIAWGVAGFGIGLAYSSLTLVVLESAPAGQEGSATSSMQMTNMAAAALATGIGGAFISEFSTGDTASRWSLSSQFLLMIAVFAVALMAARFLPIRPRRAENPEAAAEESELATRESVLSNA